MTKPILQPDFKDMLCALSDVAVEYLLVGGHAMAVHGHPRYTHDFDLWVRPSAENARRLMQALREFGAPLHEVEESDFTQANLIFQIGVPPHRIDFMTSIAGVEFGQAWPNRKDIEIEGITVPVIGKSELIANKRATGRTRDLADCEELERGDV